MRRGTSITLSEVEMTIAGMVGSLRLIKSRGAGLRDPAAKVGTADWSTDFDAACAEMALAKYLGLYWNGGVGTFKAPDVGDIYQVRSTKWGNGHLIVKENDIKPDEWFILAITDCLPAVRLIGGIQCRNAKQDKYRREDYGNNFWVPQEDLLELSEIRPTG